MNKQTRREITAALLRAGRRDLAKQFVGGISGKDDPVAQIEKFVREAARGVGGWKIKVVDMKYERHPESPNDRYARVKLVATQGDVTQHVQITYSDHSGREEYTVGIKTGELPGKWGGFFGADEKYRAKDVKLNAKELIQALANFLDGKKPGVFQKV